MSALAQRELVIAEGCFGDTSAALEALQAAESATHPVIVAAYARQQAGQKQSTLPPTSLHACEQASTHSQLGAASHAAETLTQ